MATNRNVQIKFVSKGVLMLLTYVNLCIAEDPDLSEEDSRLIDTYQVQFRRYPIKSIEFML